MSLPNARINELPLGTPATGDYGVFYSLFDGITKRYEIPAGTSSQDYEWDVLTTYAIDEVVTYGGKWWQSLGAGNIGNIPAENTHWTELSKAAQGLIDWTAGVYTEDTVFVKKDIDGSSELFQLNSSEGRPFVSSDLEAEWAAGSWTLISDSGHGNVFKTSHGFSVNQLLKIVAGVWSVWNGSDNPVALVRKVIDANNVQVMYLGEVGRGFSGLTSGNVYYMQNDGSISTTPSLYIAYIAISPTEAVFVESGPAGGGSGGWQVSGTTTITGVATVTSNAPDRHIFNGTWNAGASLDYHMDFSGSFTSIVATGSLYGYKFTPTLTGAGTNQHDLYSVVIDPTLIGGGNNTDRVAALLVKGTYTGTFGVSYGIVVENSLAAGVSAGVRIMSRSTGSAVFDMVSLSGATLGTPSQLTIERVNGANGGMNIKNTGTGSVVFNLNSATIFTIASNSTVTITRSGFASTNFVPAGGTLDGGTDTFITGGGGLSLQPSSTVFTVSNKGRLALTGIAMSAGFGATLTITPGAHTFIPSEVIANDFVGATWSYTVGGTLATNRFNYFRGPTLNRSDATVLTNWYTVYIEGATAGTLTPGFNYALGVRGRVVLDAVPSTNNAYITTSASNLFLGSEGGVTFTKINFINGGSTVASFWNVAGSGFGHYDFNIAAMGNGNGIGYRISQNANVNNGTGTSNGFIWLGGAHTLQNPIELIDWDLNFARIVQFNSNTAIATQRTMYVRGATYAYNTAGGVIAKAYTLYVDPPIAGTNASISAGYAIGVNGNFWLSGGQIDFAPSGNRLTYQSSTLTGFLLGNGNGFQFAYIGSNSPTTGTTNLIDVLGSTMLNSTSGSGNFNVIRISGTLVPTGTTSGGTYVMFNNSPTYNFTVGTQTVIGYNYDPLLSSMTGATHYAWRSTSGVALFGASSVTAGSVSLELGSTSTALLLNRIAGSPASPVSGMSWYNSTESLYQAYIGAVVQVMTYDTNGLTNLGYANQGGADRKIVATGTSSALDLYFKNKGSAKFFFETTSGSATLVPAGSATSFNIQGVGTTTTTTIGNSASNSGLVIQSITASSGDVELSPSAAGTYFLKLRASGPAGAAGGAISVIGGSPSSGNNNGGDANVTSGTPTGSGAEGNVNIQQRTSGKLGFFNVTAVVKQSVNTILVNNVTSGGTLSTIADFTSLTVYATDAAAIRNNFFRLSEKVLKLETALRNYGLAVD